MKRKILLSFLLLLSFFFLEDAFPKERPGSGDFGLGLQVSYPFSGLSGIYNLNSPLSFQGILGVFFLSPHLGVRVLYNFKVKPRYDLYFYGGGGIYIASTENFVDLCPGIGGGLGIEFFPLDNLPELGFNGEIGLGWRWPRFLLPSLGRGIHYYF